MAQVMKAHNWEIGNLPDRKPKLARKAVGLDDFPVPTAATDRG